jgi:hypothetical protein
MVVGSVTAVAAFVMEWQEMKDLHTKVASSASPKVIFAPCSRINLNA